jgi:trk system potassium uptake protein
VTKPVGAVVIGIGFATLVCALVGGIWDTLDPLDVDRPGGVYSLLGAALAMIIPGAILYRFGHAHQKKTMTRREAVLAVTIIWLAVGLVGAIPFVFAAGLSPADAFFESVSGFTTTGATVITDIEARLSRPMLLFRSLTQWLGGAGIVVLFVAIFPNVGAGGKHLYKNEVSGTVAEGLRPRIRETSLAIWKIYVTFTVLVAIVLVLVGMGPFDAICHALTTLPTGGFSTRDASIGAFDSPAIEYVLTFFMMVGGVNFGLYYTVYRQRTLRVMRRNIELRVFLWTALCAWIGLAVMNFPIHGDVEVSMRKAAFMVASLMTSTGYGADDYTLWSHSAMVVMLFLMFMGGCAGSTAGGFKVERVILLFQIAVAQVKKSFRPSSIQLVRLGKSIISDELLSDVAAFHVIFLVTLVGGVAAATLVEGVAI